MTDYPIKQPNSKMCFICGVENPVGLHLHIYETEPGVVETKYIAPEHFQGYPGVLHGGIVAAILDDALPNHITLFDLAVDPPALWDEQRAKLM